MNRRLVHKVIVTNAARDARDLDCIRHSLAADRIAEDGLVGERGRRGHCVEMPCGDRQVDRLHGVARQRMHRVERVTEPDEILVILEIAGNPAALSIRHIGRGADAAPDGIVAAEFEIAMAGAAVQGEPARHRLELLLDEGGIEMDPLAVLADRRACLSQDFHRARQLELHAVVAENPQGSMVKGLDLIVGKHPHRGIGIGDLPKGQLLDSVSVCNPPAAAPGSGHPYRPSTIPRRPCL